MKTEYKVIYQDTVEDLVYVVNTHLGEGWELQGGIAMMTDDSSFVAFAQAMVKKS